jgi:formylglycine-generating enzyme required for sulfatase activity
MRRKNKPGKLKRFFIVVGALALVWLAMAGLNGVLDHTSSDKYCLSCHDHPHVEPTWMQSVHIKNSSGTKVHCAECHLPPKEDGLAKYMWAKAKHGSKDVYSHFFKDTADINWKIKGAPEVAVGFVYKESCVKCHENMFPITLSDKGAEAHLRYTNSPDDKHCISCHISVGHHDPLAEKHNEDFGLVDVNTEIYTEAAKVSSFKNFTEKIPGTPVDFNMIAIPGGKFVMGSRPGEPGRRRDEHPPREVEVNGFWMGEIEVSWDEYLAFFSATASQGRKEATAVVNEEVDGITGPTPPWGAPDQGWGKGKRPAITMSHHAAMTYCRWLSEVTGKKYRLPTEAEWEYAARGGTSGSFFFEGNPSDFERKNIWRKVFGPDTTNIWSHVVYEENSPLMTQDPGFVKTNPFGLKNMLGNVAEFCVDYYDPQVYGKYPAGVVKNPRGPREGTERVVRGGSFKSDPTQLRVARRDFTKTKEWLVTDPQMPKSIWWYSDSKDVGFRVICEYEEDDLLSGGGK